jgi:hypothetical protein
MATDPFTQLQEGTFSFREVVSDSPKVISFDLKKQFSKKTDKRKRGGDNERASLLRAILQSHELTLTKLNRIETMLEQMRK